ncbi:MAG: hypothetical protein GQ561_06890 [Calditrichae bacterium]|nr:hypothetical protein [Calditrichia bacterium]
MIEKFETIVRFLISGLDSAQDLNIIPDTLDFTTRSSVNSETAWHVCMAFLITVAGQKHPDYTPAKNFLEELSGNSEWSALAKFFLEGISLIPREIENVAEEDSQFSSDLREVAEWVSEEANGQKSAEIINKAHILFFPESLDIFRNREEAVTALKQKRTVSISKLNPEPIHTPHREILFTANVLLTIPPASQPLGELSLSDSLKKELKEIIKEPQLYWYDHPIQIGVTPEQNETLYGLRGLDEAIAFEKKRGNVPEDAKVTCLLSVSVTHAGLHRIAHSYLKEELEKSGGLKNLKLYIFTESDTDELCDDILLPVSESYLNLAEDKDLLEVFGVDGEYGRHYSFLKAIAALWSILIDSKIRATFKIDLDQVFPQQELVKETGASAFEHFQTPLWGAEGLDYWGEQIELGMIAGALVNERDIGKSIFTPDVTFPERSPTPDEYIFFSTLPQALSTKAEMMARYNTGQLDGKNSCLQRVHVTGGTNGILIDALRRYRPFTPSFIGRAEDQAYILPQLVSETVNLGYAHKDGLIMRHDKEAFAQEAIKSAFVGKLVGDYIRILYFSEYARVIENGTNRIKQKVDPFTGCFISRIPVTVVYLRFALKDVSLFAEGKEEHGVELLRMGSQRIRTALRFTRGNPSRLHKKYEKEKRDWHIYYDILKVLDEALQKDEPSAVELKEKALNFIAQRRI